MNRLIRKIGIRTVVLLIIIAASIVMLCLQYGENATSGSGLGESIGMLDSIKSESILGLAYLMSVDAKTIKQYIREAKVEQHDSAISIALNNNGEAVLESTTGELIYYTNPNWPKAIEGATHADAISAAHALKKFRELFAQLGIENEELTLDSFELVDEGDQNLENDLAWTSWEYRKPVTINGYNVRNKYLTVNLSAVNGDVIYYCRDIAPIAEYVDYKKIIPLEDAVLAVGGALEKASHSNAMLEYATTSVCDPAPISKGSGSYQLYWVFSTIEEGDVGSRLCARFVDVISGELVCQDCEDLTGTPL